MGDTQGIPTDFLLRLFHKNSAAGVPGVVPTGGAGDGNVFMFVGNPASTSQYAPQFQNVAAITGPCFHAPARTRTSGGQVTIGDCNLTGAKTFGGQFFDGFANGYDDEGNVVTLDLRAADEDSPCLRWGTTIAEDLRWTMIELIGWRDCNDGEINVQANIVRSVSGAVLAAGPRFGGPNPQDNNFSATLTVLKNDGWGDGPGDLFPLFESDGTTENSNPVSLGFPMDTASVYEDLIALCDIDNALRGVPITDALVIANPVLDSPLIVGA